MAKASSVYPKDPEFPEQGVDDMTKLAYLHEPGVLQNLSCRYSLNEIYVSLIWRDAHPLSLLTSSRELVVFLLIM